MQTFRDDDAGYLRWLTANSGAFVLNTQRRPTRSYLVLHRATCRTITGTPARGKQWTADYIKVCGKRGDLEAFAEEIGGAASMCRLCA